MFKAKITEHDPINKESLEKLGWKYLKKYENSKREVYEKDNFFLSRSNEDHIIRIILKDPSLILDQISDPQNVRIVLKIETIQQFKSLETMLLWTSKSN
jgi:hypothetical protein